MGFLAADSCFAGVVDRVDSGVGATTGSWLRVVAYARYQVLRRARTTACYYQVTDSEVASQLAGELELAPVVEATSEIHPRVVVRGDPFAFLRAAADRCGYRLAVAAGRLYFVRELPILTRVRQPSFEREVLSCEWSLSRNGGRRGKIEVLGDGRWRPLAGFHLQAVRGIEAGHYRVDRALHSFGLDGYRTELEVSERDTRLPHVDAES